jgi:general secretion pathway protein A
MYKSFYGLKEKPFSLLPDPAYLYLSKQHEMAMTLLEYSLENQAGFCVISGKAGTGKTTLVRRLLNQIGDDVSIGLISNTHHSFGELLRWILQAFDLNDAGKTRAQLHQMFMDYLIGQYAKNRRTMLIIDEAQNMSPDALEELRMLSNINSEKDLLLQVILVGQSPLREILRRPELVQFAQRIAVDYHLESLTREETLGYIRHRIMVAGGEHELFTEDACDAVFEYCGGIPRLINLLCDYSLVYAYASQAAVVTGELVEQVVREREKYGALPVFISTREEHVKRSPPKKEMRPSKAAKLPAAGMMHAARQKVTCKAKTIAGNTKPAERQGKAINALTPEMTHEFNIETNVRESVIDSNLSTVPEISPTNNPGTVTPSRNQVVTPLKDTKPSNIPDGIGTETLSPQALPSEQPRVRKPDNPPDVPLQSRKSTPEKAIVPTPDNSVAANHSKLPSAGIEKRPNVHGASAARNGAPSAKRYVPFAVFSGVLLCIVLVWFFANLPSGPIQAATNKGASPPVKPASVADAMAVINVTPAKAVPVNDRVPDGHPLERISPVSREDAARAVAEKNQEREARLKAVERERDAALASAKAADREARRNAELAREHALAAEREMALARERERANQSALAAAKARNEARAVAAAAVVQEIVPAPVSPPPPAMTADVTAGSQSTVIDVSSRDPGTAESNDEINNETSTFATNPCKGPSARFLSTCE